MFLGYIVQQLTTKLEGTSQLNYLRRHIYSEFLPPLTPEYFRMMEAIDSMIRYLVKLVIFIMIIFDVVVIVVIVVVGGVTVFDVVAVFELLEVFAMLPEGGDILSVLQLVRDDDLAADHTAQLKSTWTDRLVA